MHRVLWLRIATHSVRNANTDQKKHRIFFASTTYIICMNVMQYISTGGLSNQDIRVFTL